MEPATMFWFLVIFAIIGFITDLIWGLDVYKMYSDFGAFLVILVMVLIFLSKEDPLSKIERVTTYFAYSLVGMLLGDAAGTFVGEIVKAIKDLFDI